MDEKITKLSKLGAGDFKHIDSTLIDHLYGTKSLLKAWQAPEVLQDAGLYHAAYGTSGFDIRLVATSQREKIVDIIGLEAEAIVYLYCACDRDYFWPQFENTNNPQFKNRFTKQTSFLSEKNLRNFCELTVANELEIAHDNPIFIDSYGDELNKLFKSMRFYLSEKANSAVEDVLGS